MKDDVALVNEKGVRVQGFVSKKGLRVGIGPHSVTLRDPNNSQDAIELRSGEVWYKDVRVVAREHKRGLVAAAFVYGDNDSDFAGIIGHFTTAQTETTHLDFRRWATLIVGGSRPTDIGLTETAMPPQREWIVEGIPDRLRQTYLAILGHSDVRDFAPPYQLLPNELLTEVSRLRAERADIASAMGLTLDTWTLNATSFAHQIRKIRASAAELVKVSKLVEGAWLGAPPIKVEP